MTAERRMPASPETERAILGAVLLGHLDDVIAAGVEHADFYVGWHGDVFDAAVRLQAARSAIDAVTVSENLRQRERLPSGGTSALFKLLDNVPSTAHVEHYARTLRQRARMRTFITEATRLTAAAYQTEESEADGFLDAAEATLFTTLRSSAAGTCVPIGKKQADVVVALFERRHAPVSRGVMSGIAMLDKITNGFRPGTLSVIGGRPHAGKTSLLLQILGFASDHGTPGLIFSLEQTETEMAERRTASDSRVDLDLIMGDGTGLSGDICVRLNRAASKRHDDRTLWIDQTPGLSIFEIRARARRFLLDAKVPRNDAPGAIPAVIGVDYIQKVKGIPRKRYQNRELEVADVSAGLKDMAKELGVPVVALAALNREVEKRPKDQRRPVMADFRESGAIESDADLAVILWRPDDEGKDNEPPAQQDITSGRVEGALLKNRSGKSGEAHDLSMYLEGKFMEFTEIARRPPPRGRGRQTERQADGEYR